MFQVKSVNRVSKREKNIEHFMIYLEFSEKKNIKKITKELLFLENAFFGKNICLNQSFY